MGIKRLFGSVAIAGIVGASTLGIGAGTANASPAHDYGRGGYWGGWHGDPYWHPWGWPWHW
jgi:hypothetical protein